MSNITFKITSNWFMPSLKQDKNVEESFCRTWDSTHSCLRSLDFDFGNGKINYKADWGEIADYVIHSIQESQWITPETTKEELSKLIADNQSQKCPIPTLSIHISGAEDSFKYSSHLVEMYLSTIFLAMNLSSPGCATFFHATVNGKDLLSKIGMGSTLFDFIWQLEWPIIRETKLNDTISWLQNVDFGRQQIAETPIERLLCALLRVTDGSIEGPTHLIWLSQALEALIDSPVERITNTLRQRLFLILGRPVNEKEIKKKINDFYNLRSRVVHGEFDMLHPAENELLDAKVDEFRHDFQDSVIFGIGILCAIAQELVRRKWSKLRYVETLESN